MSDENTKTPNQNGVRPPAGGRPPGAANKVTKQARAFAQEIIEQPGVLEALKSQMLGGIGNQAGQMPSASFRTLMEYGYGRPTEHIKVEVGEARAFEHESDDELVARAEAIARGAIAPVPKEEAN
jgi:hypothetical protein